MNLFHESEGNTFQGDIISIWKGKSRSPPCVFSIHVFLVSGHVAWVGLLTRVFTTEMERFLCSQVTALWTRFEHGLL